MRSSSAVRLACLAAFAGLAVAGPSRAAEQYALLVAVADYQNLTHLHYSRDDLTEFQKVLLHSGFRPDHVVLMHDKLDDPNLTPGVKNIREQLDLLLAKAGADDTVILALSGHGVDFVREKHSYFCPLDAKLTDNTTLLDLDDLYHKLEDCRAGRKLLLVDACHNDPSLDGSKALPIGPKGAIVKMDLQSLTRPEEADVPKGIVALFSCSPKQKSWESDELKHGVFFYYFLKGWEGAAAHQGKLTMDGVIEYTTNAMKAYADANPKMAQTPRQKNDFQGVWVLNDAGPVNPVSTDTTTDRGPATLSSHGAAVLCLAFSGDGRHVVGGCGDHTVRVWDAATGSVEAALPCDGVIVSVALDMHGRYVAAGLSDKSVSVWDEKTGKLLWSKPGLRECARGLAFNPDGQSLAVAAGSLEVMATTSDTPLGHWTGSGGCQAVAYSPSGDRLAVGSLLGRVAICKPDGEPVRQAKTFHAGGVTVLAYSPDGLRLASGSPNKTVKVYDAAELNLQCTLKGHEGGVLGIAFPPDGQCVDTVSDDRSVRAWDLSGGAEKAARPSHGGAGLPACLSPDGKRLAVVGPDKTLQVWAVDLNR